MTRHNNDDDDDDESPFDCYGVLKDGHTVRVSLQMRDAAMTRDAMARRGFDDSQARHSVGPVFTDAAGLERKAEAYRQMCDDLQNAWRTPAADDAADRRRLRKGTSRDPFGRETGSWEEEEEEDAASITYRGQQEGDQCTIDGAPGHLNARLECVPDPARNKRVKYDAAPHTIDAATARRIKQEAYDAMVRETCDAWRNPTPLPLATDAAPSPHRRDAAPLAPTFDVEEGRRRKKAALDQMIADTCSAWKHPLP